MKIRIQKRGLQPSETIEEVQSVVLLDENNNPLYVAQQHDSNTIIAERAGNPDFQKLLKALGIGLNAEYKVMK
jgi:hypothetical protein